MNKLSKLHSYENHVWVDDEGTMGDIPGGEKICSARRSTKISTADEQTKSAVESNVCEVAAHGIFQEEKW